MSETSASLRRKLATAGDLHAVVRTMKAMAASQISQYDSAVAALDAYYRTVQLALVACLQQNEPAQQRPAPPATAPIDAIVFGSDLGMVGQFNDTILAFAFDTLATLPGEKKVWAVGQRIAAQLATGPWSAGPGFDLPASIGGTAALVGELLLALDARRAPGPPPQVYLFHHRPGQPGSYAPVCQRLLPLDDAWLRQTAALRWPTRMRPEVIGPPAATLMACISEYLFVSLFRACAESQASENASRLAAMQRAEKNIDELLEQLNSEFHRLRQAAIDEELFDLVAGFEALPRG